MTTGTLVARGSLCIAQFWPTVQHAADILGAHLRQHGAVAQLARSARKARWTRPSLLSHFGGRKATEPRVASTGIVRVRLPARAPKREPAAPTRRLVYVATLLALGHELRGLLRTGTVGGVGELARRLGVSQPRVTQILNLTYLAPDIQAEILGLEAIDGLEPMSEQPLRLVLNEVGWGGQWRVFDLVVGAARLQHASLGQLAFGNRTRSKSCAVRRSSSTGSRQRTSASASTATPA